MANERFLIAQEGIQRSPEPMWERWMVDEIDEDVARVLISRAGNPQQARQIAEHVLADLGPSLWRVIREAAMHFELNPDAAEWSEETAAFVSARRLTTYLRVRGGKPGLPSRRPLREGDVFWVIAPAGITEPPLGLVGRAVAFDELVEHLERVGADVWDVTAAARQASKRSYHRVLQQTDESAGEPAVTGRDG